jgi:hypothetical protein
MHEEHAIRAAVSVAGVFAMLPLLHFLPIPSRNTRDPQKHNGQATGPSDDLLPAPMSLAPFYTAHPASPNIALPYY